MCGPYFQLFNHGGEQDSLHFKSFFKTIEHIFFLVTQTKVVVLYIISYLKIFEKKPSHRVFDVGVIERPKNAPKTHPNK